MEDKNHYYVLLLVSLVAIITILIFIDKGVSNSTSMVQDVAGDLWCCDATVSGRCGKPGVQ